jgi:hypothetical protein
MVIPGRALARTGIDRQLSGRTQREGVLSGEGSTLGRRGDHVSGAG